MCASLLLLSLSLLSLSLSSLSLLSLLRLSLVLLPVFSLLRLLVVVVVVVVSIVVGVSKVCLTREASPCLRMTVACRCTCSFTQVNGSSHTILAPYWTQELVGGASTVLHGVACSQRGGHLFVRVSVGACVLCVPYGM